jgi:uncharacterized membrane protein
MFLLLVGILGAQGSLMSGEVASDLKRGEISRNLVEMHESFASISSGIFLGIFIAYLFVLLVIYSKVYEKINIYLERKSVFLVKVLKIKKALGDFLIKNKFLFLIAGLAGFITITITGALGGALVYGKDADPFISITLKILNLY